MEEILMDRIQERGAIPFKTPVTYSGKTNEWVANNIKTGDSYAIGYAAAAMAQMVPENAVLIPMPNRTGKVTDSTDTMQLAKAISKITGAPVINALEGNERESRQADKGKKKSEQMTVKDLGFRQTAEIPEGSMPCTGKAPQQYKLRSAKYRGLIP
jgi:hypothetical protein